MTKKDIIIMSKEELKRLHVVKQVISRKQKWKEAVEALELSMRQVARLILKVRLYGDEGIIHGLRGRTSNRRIGEKKKAKILKLCGSKYEGFGPTLASEKLLELEGIKISDESLRKLLMVQRKEGYNWQRKGRKHRKWRERKANFGEMVQMDGSIHKWFDGRGPECVLMGYIDDATSRVYGRFCEYEGIFPAMVSFRVYIRKHGIPVSLYLDKHGTYKARRKLTIEEELEGKEAPETHFEHAVKQLGVKIISAHSPQAKGRVERLFKTFQDRVIKEMRLRGIKSIEEANKFLEYYLPIFNRRFSVIPRSSGNLHRPVSKGLNLDRIFCIKTKHPIRNDFTVIHEKKLYQIEDKTKAKHVVVEERVNGSIKIYAGDKSLKYKHIEVLPKRKIEVAKKPKAALYNKTGKPASMGGKQWIPPKDHPWRSYSLKKGKGLDKSYAQY